MSIDKSKAIESALLQIEKKFGKGSIMRLGRKALMKRPEPFRQIVLA
jgi:RecA/RadA recombinase